MTEGTYDRAIMWPSLLIGLIVGVAFFVIPKLF